MATSHRPIPIGAILGRGHEGRLLAAANTEAGTARPGPVSLAPAAWCHEGTRPTLPITPPLPTRRSQSNGSYAYPLTCTFVVGLPGFEPGTS